MAKTLAAYRKYPGFSQRAASSALARHLENVELLGYSVMEGVASKAELSQIVSRLSELYREQEREFGAARLKELNESEIHRGLLAADPMFAKIAARPRVLEVVHALLGETAILNLQNASAAFPRSQHYQSTFHRDFAKDFVASSPLALNAFWAVTDFTKDNGATWIVPHSHRDAEFPSADFIARNQLQLVVPAGSVVFWDGLLLHKAGFNKTRATRYGINHMYTRPFLKQQLDFPAYLEGKYDPDSKLGRLLGFWSVPPKSVKEFRVDPDKRTYRRGQG